MLHSNKKYDQYQSLAEQIINYAERSGFKEVKADFSGYDAPASLRMVNTDTTLTPDFSAKKGESKYYFELVVKNGNKNDQNQLVSKWKALETIAKMKGGNLKLFVPHGSFKYATELIHNYNIEATLVKMTEL